MQQKKYDFFVPEYKLISKPIKSLSQTYNWGFDLIKYQVAWQASRGGNALIIYGDTGLDRDHPDLKGNVLFSFDFTGENITTIDPVGHGTHVVGIGSAVDNGLGVCGVAPDSSIGMGRVLRVQGGIWRWLEALVRYAISFETDKQKILSLSMGGVTSDQQVINAIYDFFNVGGIVVAAAGNKGKDAPLLDFPARIPEVITVGSLSYDVGKDNLFVSDFSSRDKSGHQLDIVMPGEGIVSTWKNGSYATLDGTSMATPAVAGLLACITSAYPEIDNQEKAVDFLQRYSKDINEPGWDKDSGWGPPLVEEMFPEVPEPEPEPKEESKFWKFVKQNIVIIIAVFSFTIVIIVNMCILSK